MGEYVKNVNMLCPVFGKFDKLKFSKNLQLILGVIFMTLLSGGVFGGTVIRKAAVAGQFYPSDAVELRREIQKYLAGCRVLPEIPRLLISPHAGYVFSAPVAANGFASINKNIKRVFLIGPSHHVWFKGISIPKVSHYETPLGLVELDQEIISKLRDNPIVCDAKGAHEPEHCLEVQLPFLQVQLDKFKIVPILTGDITALHVAQLLIPFLDESSVVIASSDLSHYHENSKARMIDDRTIETIISGETDGFIEGCGETPIRVIMHMAQKLGLQPLKLDSRTSYETAPQYGSQSKVVGYASIVYVNKKQEITEKGCKELTEPHREYLLKLARNSLNSSVKKTADPTITDVPQLLKEDRGCFVTLTVNGNLRGCIGYIEPIKPLYQAVIDNAENAALSDPRFPVVTPKELDNIKVEVSVLTKPEPLLFSDANDLLKKLVPGVHGVILQMGSRQSTFLPQVWEQLPDKIQFLEHLSIKAGMPRDAWKTANVKTYTAQHFSE